ncbi:uncharacterized protein J7T54_006891 [Emericellopsis cladophorae]|uniref:Uncharacterized protein n=1 Tax=Emericellopsis cladophorae TaxID=2686198 RepID=A0A9P9Y9G6_9HYPO|nr:uncharacterized protein J7T54_006891 [Emericellopsis cladophorae]KAI6785249.1 hypothetical protein J7T54_006891 [Emericellopsis cladophorae]
MGVEEAADAYGRREGYFIDHQSHAFSFKEALRILQLKATSGIIHQPDLTAASFPLTKIKFGSGDDPVACRRAEDLCRTASNKRPMLFLSEFSFVRDSDIRLELPELTSNPDGDVEEYVRMVRSRLASNLSTQWLPLSPTKVEKDEGLQFPKHASRLRALLLRELDCERVPDSGESVLLDDPEHPSILGQLPNTYVNGHRSHSQRSTPPLTPLAEEAGPYIPSTEACQIDFTSEPQSPSRSSEARFRDRLEIGQLDSDIASAASLTASPGLPVFHPGRAVNPRDLMLDEPIVDKRVNGISVAKGETYPSEDLPVLELCEEDVIIDDQPADGYFDEAFAAILEDRRSACMRTVEQERFDPVDSIARIRVPPMGFMIPPPLWKQHTQGSRQMFEWVLNDAAWVQSAQYHPMSKDYDSMLGWAPFAPTAGARRKEVTLPPAHEADISLTPTTGLIVTTLLKVKQRSLPNAKALPQLRERVLGVSRKYESLIVLVSEGNTAGEYANDHPSSDMKAYAEFVRFASALQAGVTVHLVPGAEGILAKWVLKFMCEHSPRNREVSMFIQAQETSWEIYFRRGGMNVLAAQVTAGVLHQRMGNQGLADFVAMSVEQRIATYGSFLGGPKLLAKFSNTLDQSCE